MDKKVYLLEDDKSISELVKCALEMSGIGVECYGTVAEFTAAAEKDPPSVALLDIMLPDGSGLDVLARLKQKHPAIGVIMLSALGQETDKVRGRLRFQAVRRSGTDRQGERAAAPLCGERLSGSREPFAGRRDDDRDASRGQT